MADMTERERQILEWEARGELEPECPGCAEFYRDPDLPRNVFAPRHKAKRACRSGSYAHCTCDTCF